jgi:ketosteroid isomerase-like protein
MSENLDLVRSIYADWERGDYSSVEWAHPQIEFVLTDGPSPGSWTGVAGMAQVWGDFLSAWEGHRAHPESYRELDDNRILVFVEGRGRAKHTRMEFGEGMVKTAAVYEVRDRKVTRLLIYFDRDRALADLGLKE